MEKFCLIPELQIILNDLHSLIAVNLAEENANFVCHHRLTVLLISHWEIFYSSRLGQDYLFYQSTPTWRINVSCTCRYVNYIVFYFLFIFGSMQQCLSEGAFSTVWLAQDIGMAVFFSLPGIAFIYFILRIHSEASLAVKMSISF